MRLAASLSGSTKLFNAPFGSVGPRSLDLAVHLLHTDLLQTRAFRGAIMGYAYLSSTGRNAVVDLFDPATLGTREPARRIDRRVYRVFLDGRIFRDRLVGGSPMVKVSYPRPTDDLPFPKFSADGAFVALPDRAAWQAGAQELVIHDTEGAVARYEPQSKVKLVSLTGTKLPAKLRAISGRADFARLFSAYTAERGEFDHQLKGLISVTEAAKGLPMFVGVPEERNLLAARRRGGQKVTDDFSL